MYKTARFVGTSALNIRSLCFHPLFLLGLSVKLFLIFYIQPVAVSEWYVPFLQVTMSQFTLDPWSAWLNNGGTLDAFPYGYVMWIVFLPLILLSKILGVPMFYGYGFTLLVTDLSLFVVLSKLFSKHNYLLLPIYWLSPIVLLATYGLGLNDLVPVLFLVSALYFTQQKDLFYAGVFCVAAISAKLSMVIALPFFLIYLVHNRPLRQLFPRFLKGALLASVVFILPFIASASGLYMLFNNPLIDNVYQFKLSIGNNINVYIVPLVYLVMLYSAWRIRRLNFELFISILGMSFLLVAILTPASPGWFVWVVPLLVFYQIKSDKVAIALSSIFSLLYVVSTLLAVPELTFSIAQLNIATPEYSIETKQHVISLFHTIMIAIGIVLAVRIWREMVSRNDYFRLSRKPLVIGVAGDSGAGKITLSKSLEGLFGKHSVTILSGDNYQRWDRQKPIWQVMSCLNPIANNLKEFCDDLLALIDGKSVQTREYDHQTGQMSRPFAFKGKDIIIASGLHALYLPTLRERYDLSIYLDIDEGLRKHFKLLRDVNIRGFTTKSVLSFLEKGKHDSINFIKPQVLDADLILSLQPIHSNMLDGADQTHPLRLKLVVKSCRLNEVLLTRVLVGVCGLHVDSVINGGTSMRMQCTGYRAGCRNDLSTDVRVS